MINFSDLLSALRQRIALVAIVGLAIFAAIMALGLQMPREYAATSSLVIDLSDTDPIGRDKIVDSNASVIDSVIGTQVDILQSNAVLERVVRTSPELVGEEPGAVTGGAMDEAVRELRDNFAVATENGSNVIRLSYASRSPEMAAATLNRIVDVFLEEQVELRAAPARQSAEWFDERSADARDRLEAAQARLSSFQRANGIVGTDRMDVEADRVRALSLQLVDAQAAAASARATAGAGAVPDVVRSDVSQNVERDLSVQAGKVAELSKTLGPNHPEMIAARAELDALRRALSSARSTQQRSLSAAARAASSRESQLQSELAAAQNRLLAMSSVQDELNVLQRDVDVARQSYEQIRQRLNDEVLSSQVSQANATLLDRATPPTMPFQPNLVLFFAAALVLGGTGGLLVGIAAELLRPRVRTSSGVAHALDLDVIADMEDEPRRRGRWRSDPDMEYAA